MSKNELKEKLRYSQMLYREERIDYLNELLQSILDPGQIKTIQKEIDYCSKYETENE